MRKFLIALGVVMISGVAYSQKVMDLYPGEIPGAKGAADEEVIKDGVARKVSHPTLTIFTPPAGKANGTSVIICPGGGYGVLVIDREGYQVAKAFNEAGVTAFVLKYRLPDSKHMQNQAVGPLQDVQQAIKTIRENSTGWKLDPLKIGVMGFSAGGHLAATAGTHFDSTFIENKNKTSLRPDFMILVYPVISFMDGIGHVGSAKNLLGSATSSGQQRYFSNEFQVTSKTPPAFITHASDDTVVPVAHSILFYEALTANKVLSEMHIYARGEHGYLKRPAFAEWFGRNLAWMSDTGFLPR
ncbi:Acetylxylan esterase [Dyadobacter sp. CECT 9275]|uniref:Acetylxylan esterase n=1 Tax=Dyadobacter helix TaxID=2822344 RepID=A0A916JER0_9BACT|nr:alpha/beta hydrolase [Dyadobacter sp. CECT 9275]CAG5009951.1 Acetylxylan esterase [Dyadobacter sp. CECT 9275]